MKKRRPPVKQVTCQAEFVGDNAPELVKERMSQVVADVGEGKPDEFRAAAARRVFRRVEW